MPKSKRNKIVSLTKTDRKGHQFKEQLVNEIQQCAQDYAYVYIFSVHNMRNNKLKEVRTAWRTSRFFFGKNKIMQVALGRSEEEEVQENISEISKRLVGNVGVLFTNKAPKECLQWFGKHREADFARSGFAATETVKIPEGPLPQFSHAIEPQLRKLGLPTYLAKGIVSMRYEHVICRKGDILTPEQARLLKLFEISMANFEITIEHVWHQGKFETLKEEEDNMDE